MRSLSKSSKCRRTLVLLAATVGWPSAVYSQYYQWGATAGGAWDTSSASWLLNGNTPLTQWVNGSEARFGATFSGTRAMTMGAGISAIGIDLRSGGTGVYSFSGASGITLNNSGGDEYITVSNPTGSFYTGQHLFSTPITFTDTLKITNDGGIFGAISLNLTGAINSSAAVGKIVFDGAGHTWREHHQRHREKRSRHHAVGKQSE